MSRDIWRYNSALGIILVAETYCEFNGFVVTLEARSDNTQDVAVDTEIFKELMRSSEILQKGLPNILKELEKELGAPE